MEKWISREIILSLILSFSLVSSVTAEETKIGLLKAESESEVQLDRVEIYKDENGYDRVRITDTRPANGEPEKYRITVNRERVHIRQNFRNLQIWRGRKLNLV